MCTPTSTIPPQRPASFAPFPRSDGRDWKPEAAKADASRGGRRLTCSASSTSVHPGGSMLRPVGSEGHRPLVGKRSPLEFGWEPRQAPALACFRFGEGHPHAPSHLQTKYSGSVKSRRDLRSSGGTLHSEAPSTCEGQVKGRGHRPSVEGKGRIVIAQQDFIDC